MEYDLDDDFVLKLTDIINLPLTSSIRYILRHTIVRKDEQQLLAYLNKYPSHINYQYICTCACMNDFLPGVKIIIEYGIQNKISIRFDYEDENTMCPFEVVVKSGNVDIMKYLIELSEQDVESYGRFDLHMKDNELFEWACAKGHFHMLKYLVKLGEESYG